jgi:hypothetical protein
LLATLGDRSDDAASGEALLGAAHHRRALSAFDVRYRALKSGGGNAARLPAATAVATSAERWLAHQGRHIVLDMAPELRLGGATLVVAPEAAEVEDAFLHRAMGAISALALACRAEPRRPGTLNGFLDCVEIDELGREHVISGVNFLSDIGRDLLALYLLLWETLLVTGRR